MARNGSRRAKVSIAVVLIVATVAVLAVPPLWQRYAHRLKPDACSVTLDGDTYALTLEQADNAALIAAGAQARQLKARAATIGIATGIQESSLRNIDYGDRDSLGLFQQRPSQGWGEPEQLLNRHYATGAFYDVLVTVTDWENLPITEAAQAVQRSGFPDAYADHEPEARAWASALTGNSGPGMVNCHVDDAVVGSPAAVADRIAADFGPDLYQVTVVNTGAEETVLQVTSTKVEPTDGDALSTWAAAVAPGLGISRIEACGAVWVVEKDGWSGLESAPTAGCAPGALLTVRTAPAS